MEATERQKQLAIELINIHPANTGTAQGYHHRVLLTAKQHRTLTEGWESGVLPWGNKMSTTKGVMDWRLQPGPLGYFLEYTLSRTTIPTDLLSESDRRKEEAVQKYATFVTKQQAKTTTLVTGEMWKVYRGKEWVKLNHPVKMQAYCISGGHLAKVMLEWGKLKVDNIQTEIFTQPELLAA